MIHEFGYLFLVSVAYLCSLFLIASAAERGLLPRRLVRNPWVYTLSLGVYASSWSYYGSVGFADRQGLLFLTIYIGPTLAFLLAPILLKPILRLTREFQFTSIADLFAFRYNSQLAGILVSIFALLGSLPYIALQIRAVTESITVLTETHYATEIGFVFCVVLTLFAILFGARHVSPREKHEGLVVAIAFESLIKLAALLIVAGFAVFGVFGGVSELDRWLAERPELLESLYAPAREGPWLTLIFLSFAAAFLLPRQFHIAFVENLEPRSLDQASWAFPLLLLLFNLAIPPILWAGEALGSPISPDYHVLGISLSSGSLPVATLAYLGGLSAASAMIIVTTLALSSMLLNHILLPASYPDPAVDLYRWLLWGRRMIIGLLILTGYGMFVVLENRGALVDLGLISFVAVAQFLPGLAGVLYWKGATRAGLLSGLLAGFAVWHTSLLMPLLREAGVILSEFNLRDFMGLSDSDIWLFSTFWSLSLNTILFIAVSVLTRQDNGERRAVASCFREPVLSPEAAGGAADSAAELSQRLSGIIGANTGASEVRRALADLSMSNHERRPHELQRLRDRLERNLSGMVGPMLARMIVGSLDSGDRGAREIISDQMRFVEDRLERSRSELRGLARELDTLRRYHRQVLQDLPMGACSVSGQGEILTWNQAMAEVTGLSAGAALGERLTRLPPPWGALLVRCLEHQSQHLLRQQISSDGNTRWLNLHKAAIEAAPWPGGRLAQPRLDGTVILVEDFTDMQTLEAELTHSERLASIGRLAAGVAHEIGNPVTGIACIAQNLQQDDDPELLREGLEEILEQTRRIDDIVQSLSSFSRSGFSTGERFSQFDLHQCLQDARRLVQLSREGKHLDIRVPAGQGLVIEADRQRLLQVFVNLLSNACDASGPGGLIEMRTRVGRDGVQVSVRDHGHGIPPSTLEKVLEPFFTTKEPGKGTGLGLPLAHKILQDHGGQLAIESDSGGTRVTVTLPLQQPGKASLNVHEYAHVENSDHRG